jgi:hypothetical protein
MRRSMSFWKNWIKGSLKRKSSSTLPICPQTQNKLTSLKFGKDLSLIMGSSYSAPGLNWEELKDRRSSSHFKRRRSSLTSIRCMVKIGTKLFNAWKIDNLMRFTMNIRIELTPNSSEDGGLSGKHSCSSLCFNTLGQGSGHWLQKKWE